MTTGTSVHDIVLSARADCPRAAQMSNFWVRVLDDDDDATILWEDTFITDPSEILPNGGSLWVKLPSAVDGQYVQVQVDDISFSSPWFSIAEVQVGDVARYDYSQSAGGTLGIELDPISEPCDKLVAGAVTLAGTLDVTSFGGEFAAGQVFDIFDWSSLTGTFDAVNLPTLSGGLSWDTSSLYTTGELTVVPEPSAIALLLVGILGLLSATGSASAMAEWESRGIAGGSAPWHTEERFHDGRVQTCRGFINHCPKLISYALITPVFAGSTVVFFHYIAGFTPN